MADLPAIKDTNLLFLDTETGGLNARDHDLVSVACILTDPTGQTVLEEYDTLVYPMKPVDPKAAAVNGYTKEAWDGNAIHASQAMVKVLQMLNGAMMVCHNTPFDKSFIEAALWINKQKWTGRYHTMDTMVMAMPFLRAGLVENIKLETLTKYFGIEHVKHRALGDVRACRQVFLRFQDIYGSAIEAHIRERAAAASASGAA